MLPSCWLGRRRNHLRELVRNRKSTRASHRRELVAEVLEDRRLLSGLQNSLELDGNDDVVTVPFSNQTLSLGLGRAFTVEAWIRHEHLEGTQTIVGERSFALLLRDGKISLFGQSGSQQVPRDVWTHVAVVWESSDVQNYYINGHHDAIYGASTGTFPGVAAGLTIGATQVALNVGDPSDVFINELMGNIGEVRVWNQALSEGDIRHSMNAAIEDRLPGLVASWHLSGDTNDTFGHCDGTQRGNARVFGLPSPAQFAARSRNSPNRGKAARHGF